jgi:hypothetical protein
MRSEEADASSEYHEQKEAFAKYTPRQFEACPKPVKACFSFCDSICLLCAFLVILLNLPKIPFYYSNIPATNVTYNTARCTVLNVTEEDAIWCHGIETGILLRTRGVRGMKIYANPGLFVVTSFL